MVRLLLASFVHGSLNFSTYFLHSHETGHFLGLLDMYDGNGPVGIGNWGMMVRK